MKLKNLISSIIIALSCFFLLSCDIIGRHTPSPPLTVEEILEYLEQKYNEDFVLIKQEKKGDKNSATNIYSFSPANNKDLTFYVADGFEIKVDYGEYNERLFYKEDDSSAISIEPILSIEPIFSPARRYVLDSYAFSLLEADFENIAKVYDNLILPALDINHPTTIYEVCSFIGLRLAAEYEYGHIVNIADILTTDVNNYVSENFAKYKDNGIRIGVNCFNRVAAFDSGQQTVTDALTRGLIENYRKNSDQRIFDIPATVKQQFDVGWIYNPSETISRVAINGVITDRKLFFKVENKSTYFPYALGYEKFEVVEEAQGNLDAIEMPALSKSDEKLVNEKDLPPPFAYRKNGEIYVIANHWAHYDSRGTIKYPIKYVYKYTNSKLVRDHSDWIDRSDGLDKYFGIKISYDFETEILNISF